MGLLILHRQPDEFGIDNNVEEYLLQLGAVPHDLRQVREANERTNFSYE